jgi:hypothetical protein
VSFGQLKFTAEKQPLKFSNPEADLGRKYQGNQKWKLILAAHGGKLQILLGVTSRCYKAKSDSAIH